MDCLFSVEEEEEEAKEPGEGLRESSGWSLVGGGESIRVKDEDES